jgi:hypothetical protein
MTNGYSLSLARLQRYDRTDRARPVSPGALPIGAFPPFVLPGRLPILICKTAEKGMPHPGSPEYTKEGTR